ncbi:hypothetical protein HAP32_00310 [Serratia fonticola]|nr:hypothetical protein HAP32_00310 [Serratia fonticola]
MVTQQIISVGAIKGEIWGGNRRMGEVVRLAVLLNLYGATRFFPS